jgi:hypothetical protein
MKRLQSFSGSFSRRSVPTKSRGRVPELAYLGDPDRTFAQVDWALQVSNL